jgi:hypothetical protein
MGLLGAYPREKAGTIDSKPVYLSKRGERWFIDLYEYDENLEYVYWSSPSEARLFAFIEQEVGPIIWSA